MRHHATIGKDEDVNLDALSFGDRPLILDSDRVRSMAVVETDHVISADFTLCLDNLGELNDTLVLHVGPPMGIRV